MMRQDEIDRQIKEMSIDKEWEAKKAMAVSRMGRNGTMNNYQTMKLDSPWMGVLGNVAPLVMDRTFMNAMVNVSQAVMSDESGTAPDGAKWGSKVYEGDI